MKGTYTRWTKTEDSNLTADILSSVVVIKADPATGLSLLSISGYSMNLNADEARMIGVRLIEAATLADNGRSVRE